MHELHENWKRITYKALSMMLMNITVAQQNYLIVSKSETERMSSNFYTSIKPLKYASISTTT